jgi:hypothetical protein
MWGHRPQSVQASWIMSAAKPKEKATKASRPDLPAEDAWYNPINLEKKRLNEEDEGKDRQTESWHSFGTF